VDGHGKALWTAIQPLRSKAPEFAKALPSCGRKGVVWLWPDLVAEVEFRGCDDLLRAASFKSLREDKDAREVSRK
jgi:bifunctional non-homologous end joining protein LigD